MRGKISDNTGVFENILTKQWRKNPHPKRVRILTQLLKLGDTETAESGWVEIGTLTATGDVNAYFNYACEGVNCRASAVKLVPIK